MSCADFGSINDFFCSTSAPKVNLNMYHVCTCSILVGIYHAKKCNKKYSISIHLGMKGQKFGKFMIYIFSTIIIPNSFDVFSNWFLTRQKKK